MSLAIKPSQFIPKNLTADKPKSRQVKDEKGDDLTVWSIKLKYEYPNGQVKDGLQVDLPALVNRTGVKSNPKKGYTLHQLTGTLELAEGNNQEFYDNFVMQYNERILELIIENYEIMNGPPKTASKDKLAKYRTLAEEKYFTSFFMPFDKKSKQPIEGGQPLTRLFLSGRDKFQTIFTDIMKQPLSDPETGKRCSFEEAVDLLSGVGFSFCARVTYYQIDCGALNYSSANSIKSAIIYNFTEASDESHQDEAAEELQQKLGLEAVKSFNAQWLEIKKKAKASKPADTLPLTGTVYQSEAKKAPYQQKKVPKTEEPPEDAAEDSAEAEQETDADPADAEENQGSEPDAEEPAVFVPPKFTIPRKPAAGTRKK